MCILQAVTVAPWLRTGVNCNSSLPPYCCFRVRVRVRVSPRRNGLSLATVALSPAAERLFSFLKRKPPHVISFCCRCPGIFPLFQAVDNTTFHAFFGSATGQPPTTAAIRRVKHCFLLPLHDELALATIALSASGGRLFFPRERKPRHVVSRCHHPAYSFSIFSSYS